MFGVDKPLFHHAWSILRPALLVFYYITLSFFVFLVALSSGRFARLSVKFVAFSVLKLFKCIWTPLPRALRLPTAIFSNLPKFFRRIGRKFPNIREERANHKKNTHTQDTTQEDTTTNQTRKAISVQWKNHTEEPLTPKDCAPLTYCKTFGQFHTYSEAFRAEGCHLEAY